MTGEGMGRVVMDFHDPRYQYSDGQVEEDILSYVTTKKDLHRCAIEDGRWPVIYHLSDVRRNLLEWYEFDQNASLLEVGAGCGALTGLFCEKVSRVVAVEISPKRAEILKKRHSDHDNLWVYVGRLQDISKDEKFDYITLIGVLEYASLFDDGEDPHLALLKNCIERLKPGGILIVAIENRIGIKYLAGAPEDHTGNLFEGIEGYPSGSSPRTFDRKELNDLMVKAGIRKVKFFYPWPDYKMPELILSDSYLPRIGMLRSYSPNYDQPRFRLFNEGAAMDSISGNTLSAELSNSLLVFCEI